MQKPLARSREAWCSPPPKFTARTALTVQDGSGRQQGAAGQPGGGFVHAGEGGIVLGAEAPGLVGGCPGLR